MRGRRVRRRRWIPSFDSKRVLTRFGVVEMPQQFDPDDVTTEQLLVNRTLKLVPTAELPEAVRKVIAKMSLERLPDLHPKPVLTAAQMDMLQVVAELEAGRQCDWDKVTRAFGLMHDLGDALLSLTARKVGDALIRRRLITAEGPSITLKGRARVRAEDEVEYWRERLELREYRLERIEVSPNPDYDEIFFVRNGNLECYFRHECFEVRAKPKIVVLSNYS